LVWGRKGMGSEVSWEEGGYGGWFGQVRLSLAIIFPMILVVGGLSWVRLG